MFGSRLEDLFEKMISILLLHFNTRDYRYKFEVDKNLNLSETKQNPL